ncbi:MAG: right-handed parallel beta-helix repeat-containing protein, partial [Lachnospiraceae bacterium]|nr:right-handed parallel beta-helix repeat-containing protein [Lachnospiraceae bacterium]
MAKTYYVDCTAKKGNGSKKKPFATISEAALIAEPGDEVIVADGIYRENVDPKNGGTEKARITYRAEHPGKAVITGAEQVKSWARHEGTVWVTTIKNSKFKEKNPYTDLVYGDWYWPMLPAHRGEVFLNDKSLYEVATLEEVMNPKVYKRSWDPAFTIYTWYTEQSGDYTRIYANFQGADPNVENVEITFRSNCFYPQKEGIGYITLDGFKICKAACQWAPPTAYQEGMVGPHWSKGWIIENCEISHAKCSGISLGKYLQPENDNKWSKFGLKDGTQTERDAICQAQNDGWSKETVGSHIIRNCDIHDCGQTGIVGHMGGVFSIIENNHFHHINNKQNLGGAEIGGIKLHAAIDVTIRNNRFDHCTRGLWLDWQAQGTRVTQNIFYDNNIPGGELEGAEGAVGEDIFVEVSHGPTLIDNNLLLSDCSLRMCTQGFAVVHNFIAGSIVGVGQGVCNGTAELPSPRYTPY